MMGKTGTMGRVDGMDDIRGEARTGGPEADTDRDTDGGRWGGPMYGDGGRTGSGHRDMGMGGSRGDVMGADPNGRGERTLVNDGVRGVRAG